MSVASPLAPAVVAEVPSFADASASASPPAAAAAAATAAPAESASSPAPESAAALAPTKSKEEFRNYEDSFRHEKVRSFYEEQHRRMTYDFVLEMEKKYLKLDHFEMGIWEALEYLDSFIDDSDPDTEHSQMQHALQTAESIRRMYPAADQDWFALVGLIHDIGKILAIACKEPQWCTVGDTFPVGCAFSPACVFPQYFASNPDSTHPVYSTELGVYAPHCGLANVKMSWGHDEYLFQVCVRNHCTLPAEGLAAIRFHSFYPWHTQGAYAHLLDAHDGAMLQSVLRFNAHDLYSKSQPKQDVQALKPYYLALIAKYFPAADKLKW